LLLPIYHAKPEKTGERERGQAMEVRYFFLSFLNKIPFWLRGIRLKDRGERKKVQGVWHMLDWFYWFCWFSNDSP